MCKKHLWLCLIHSGRLITELRTECCRISTSIVKTKWKIQNINHLKNWQKERASGQYQHQESGFNFLKWCRFEECKVTFPPSVAFVSLLWRCEETRGRSLDVVTAASPSWRLQGHCLIHAAQRKEHIASGFFFLWLTFLSLSVFHFLCLCHRCS